MENFKNSLSAQLAAQKHSYHFYSFATFMNSTCIDIKGHGHGLIPRLSLCPMNTLNRHTHNTLISCYGLTISGSPWPLIANFKLNFNIQCTDFNQVGPLNA